MKSLSLTNRRILVGFLLVGLMIIKSTFLEKTKEGFTCVLDSTGDPCSYKNNNNYSEKYKHAKWFVKYGYRKELRNAWEEQLSNMDKHKGITAGIKLFEEFLWYQGTLRANTYGKYVLSCLTIIKSMFIPSSRYNLKCFYACKKNKKKCENDHKFLNYNIVKMFIKKFNNLFGITVRDDLFDKCKNEGSYNHVECCSYISEQRNIYQYSFFAFLGFIFLIFLLIFLYIFYKKL